MRTVNVLMQVMCGLAVSAAAQANSLEEFTRGLCEPDDLKISTVPDEAAKPLPEWVGQKVEPALATFIATRPVGVDRERVGDGFIRGFGTGFAVQTGAGTVWLSAGHILSELKDGRRMVALLATKKFMRVNADGDQGYLDLAAITNAKAELSGKTFWTSPFNAYNGRSGFDWGQVNDSELSHDGDSVKPLIVRDLIAQPLAMNEPVFLAGMQLGQMKAFACAYRGLDLQSFETYRNLNFFAKCANVPVDSRGDAMLGGISGGVMLDKSGLVVGVFNGFSMPAYGNAEISIRGVPLYNDPDHPGRFQPYPPLPKAAGRARCLPCYDHDQFGRDDSATDAELHKGVCALGYGSGAHDLDLISINPTSLKAD